VGGGGKGLNRGFTYHGSLFIFFLQGPCDRRRDLNLSIHQTILQDVWILWNYDVYGMSWLTENVPEFWLESPSLRKYLNDTKAFVLLWRLAPSRLFCYGELMRGLHAWNKMAAGSAQHMQHSARVFYLIARYTPTRISSLFFKETFYSSPRNASLTLGHCKCVHGDICKDQHVSTINALHVFVVFLIRYAWC